MEQYERQALTERQYRAMCAMLDRNNFNYEGNEERYMIRLDFEGDHGDIRINVHFDADRCLASVLTLLPVSFGEETMLASVAIAHTNYLLLDGWFIMDPKSGGICFKITSSYHGTDLEEENLHRLIGLSYQMANTHAGVFKRLASGDLTLYDFLQGKTE